MSNYLYRRVLSCKIESPNGESKTFEHDVDNGKLFRIDFSADFKGDATISLYNVLEATINMTKFSKVANKTIFPKLQLSAGYESDLYLIAEGEIIQSLVKISGPDRILEMKIAPKAYILNEYAQTKQYNGTLQTILRDFLLDNGITSYQVLTSFGTNQNFYDFAATGTVEKNLSRLCELLFSEYSFYLGKLLIATKDQTTYLKTQKVVLDKDSGLVQSPAKKGLGYTVKSLLNPRIAPNQIVHLTFRDLNSKETKIDKEFIAKSGKHFGSSFGNDYYTEFEVVAK